MLGDAPRTLLLALFEATASEPFRSLHDGVRRAYAGPVRATVERALKVAVGRSDIGTIARHSVVEGDGGFNAFGSDLDLTISVAGAFDLALTDRLRRAHERLRGFFPFLGEIEIFSRDELALFVALEREHGPTLRLLRDLKKIRWMEWRLAKQGHPYDVFKCKRAIRRLLSKLEGAPDAIADSGNYAQLGPAFENKLLTIAPRARARALAGISGAFNLHQYTRELDAAVSTTRRPGALCLGPDAALLLLAIGPNHAEFDSALVERLDRVREHEDVRSLHIAVLTYELLYANASPRVHVEHRDRYQSWVDALTLQLKAWASPPIFADVVCSLNAHVQTLRDAQSDCRARRTSPPASPRRTPAP